MSQHMIACAVLGRLPSCLLVRRRQQMPLQALQKELRQEVGVSIL